jgi:hypothetical protein
MMEEVRVGGATVLVLPAVRGLPSEGAAAARAVESLSPDVVALSIAPEELTALKRYGGGPVEPENFEEEIYVAGLSAWETPVKPAPCFTDALRAAGERRIRVEALDMDEEAYTTAYLRYVSAMELILQGRVEARLARRKFSASAPADFVLAWDAEVNRAAGFTRLQREREAHMARRLREIAPSARRVLAVVEVERSAGVVAALRA